MSIVALLAAAEPAPSDAGGLDTASLQLTKFKLPKAVVTGGRWCHRDHCLAFTGRATQTLQAVCALLAAAGFVSVTRGGFHHHSSPRHAYINASKHTRTHTYYMHQEKHQ